MDKIKENALTDFYNVIQKSWTYNRLTEKERKQFDELVQHSSIQSVMKGNWKTRWEIINSIYRGFLYGCGYHNSLFNWREE